MTLVRILRRAAGGAALMVLTTLGPAMADFRGGGVLFNFTEACRQHGWPVGSVTQGVIRYAPAELRGNPSQVSVILNSSAEHIAVWQNFVAGPNVYASLGRHMGTIFFLTSPPDSPRVQIISRRITERINPLMPETIQNAREVTLRLRIANWNGLSGCGATLVATLMQRTD